MKHIFKTKNTKNTKNTKRVNRKKSRNVKHSSQSGGVKVIIGMVEGASKEKPINREVLTIEQFQRILNTAINLEVISCSSLNSFVVKVQLAEGRDFFKSDMVGEDGKKLDFLEIMDSKSGRVITEIILKICIIGHSAEPADYVFNKKSFDKRAVSVPEFLNEYQTQRYLYSAMMSTSGSPFCPDAFGMVEIKTAPDLSMFDGIKDTINPSSEFHTILAYLTKLVTTGWHRLGIIMMESVPGNYSLFTEFIPGRSRFNQKSYEELSELLCAINILTIYRGKLFLLDAHPNNWLCDPALPILSKVKAIDFGRVYRIHSQEAITHFLNSVKDNLVKYFARISCVAPDTFGKTTADFFALMGVAPREYAQLVSQTPSSQSRVTAASKLLEDNLRELIDIFRGDIFFATPFEALTPEKRAMSINMIHRLILTLSLIDGFFNDTKFVEKEVRRAQQYESYKQLYDTNMSTPDLIIGSGMRMNFSTMVGHPKYQKLSKTYAKVYQFIYQYCEDRYFPVVRGYEAFKKVERTISRQAAIKLTPAARATGSKLGAVCKVVGDTLGRIGMETGPFLERRVMNPIFDTLVYTPTMWAAYKLKLVNAPPPPPKVFAKSTGGGNRTKKRKNKRAH